MNTGVLGPSVVRTEFVAAGEAAGDAVAAALLACSARAFAARSERKKSSSGDSALSLSTAAAVTAAGRGNGGGGGKMSDVAGALGALWAASSACSRSWKLPPFRAPSGTDFEKSLGIGRDDGAGEALNDVPANAAGRVGVDGFCIAFMAPRGWMSFFVCI
jgi:hypothetical protein